MNFTRFGMWSSAAIVAASVFSVSEVRAQAGASVLTGRVVDASTKAPVPDCVVTITSTALQGEETAVTDSNGFYRVQSLPPGDYTIRLEKETFKPYARSVPLRADVTLRADAELLPDSLTQEVVVVVAPPTVDVGSSNTGVSIDNGFSKRVPLVRPGNAAGGAVRSFEAVAQAAPQASGDDFGTSINGTTSPENNFVVDGLSRNNAGFGTNGARLSMEFVKEVNVLTGGYLPEYGAAGGGIISAVTKSGSNEYHGSAWANYSPGWAEGNRKRIFRQGTTIATQPSLNLIGDIGAEVGGPIVQDKLWFYAGVILARQSYDLDRSINNSVSGEINGATKRYQAEREDQQVFAKLTWAANARNRFNLTFYTLPSQSGGSNRAAIDPGLGVPAVGNVIGTPDALFNRITTNTTSIQLDWDTEAPSKKVLLKTTVGWMHQSEDTLSNDGFEAGSPFGTARNPSVNWARTSGGLHGINDFESIPGCDAPNTNPAVLCPVTSYFSGGPGFLTSRTFERVQGRSVLTLIGRALGQHIIKVGVEGEWSAYASSRGYSGGNQLQESSSGNYFYDVRNFSYLTGPDQRVVLPDIHNLTHSVIIGGFAQDSWSVMDKVTINGGLRYDAQLLFGGDGNLALTLPNMIAPRIGVVYDPTQKGNAKIYGNFSQYYQTAPLNIVDRGAGAGDPQTTGYHRKANCDPRVVAQLTTNCADPATAVKDLVGATSNGVGPDRKYSVVGAGRTPIDKDLKPQFSNELVFGAEYDIIKNGRIGLSYTHRWIGRVIEDVSRDEAQTYFITNPGEGATADFPKPKRDYDAATLFFQKTFNNNWEVLASYTLSYLRGNYAGLFRPETDQIDPLTNSDFDLRSLTINRSGSLPGDTRHQFKAFGSRTIELNEKSNLSLGGAIRGTSGAPTEYLGRHPIYGADEIFILPRGSGNRLPWTYGLDTNIGYTVKLGGERTVALTMDIFNLFNFQEITNRDQRYTNSAVNPIPDGKISDLGQLKTTTGDLLQKKELNPNFGNPTSYQAPRQFRFGLRGTF